MLVDIHYIQTARIKAQQKTVKLQHYKTISKKKKKIIRPRERKQSGEALCFLVLIYSQISQ